MIRGNAPRADVLSAQRDVPEHVPGSAGTAEATGCGSNARPWRKDTSQPGYRCRQRIRQGDPPRITTCADGGWNRSQSGYLLRDEAADA